MTFADAAIAYELIQSGLSERSVAPFFGVSRTTLGRVIKSCLDHGSASPALESEFSRRPFEYSKEAMKQTESMRLEGLPFKTIARRLRTDSERLRKAYCYYDRPKTGK